MKKAGLEASDSPAKKLKLEAVHAAEVAKLRRQIRELEEARANLLRATKPLTQPLELAISAEAAKRKAVEAELEALKRERIDAAAAREAAEAAERNAADAISARDQIEAQAAQELLRTKEFISSHDDKLERVRHYAESVEVLIRKVDEENAAIEARWRGACDAEIERGRLQTALKVASVKHEALEASEQARTAARVAQLGSKHAQVLAASAEVKATAAVVVQMEQAAAEQRARQSSEKDALLREATEARLEALELEHAAHKAQYEARLGATGDAGDASMAEAEARVKALEKQTSAMKAEVACLFEWNTAKTHEAHLTAIVKARAAQLLQGEMAAKLRRIEAEVRNCPQASSGLHPQVLEQAVADAAAALEYATSEARAKALYAETISGASIELEKQTAAVILAAERERTAAERDGASLRAAAVEKAADAVQRAYAKAEELKTTAFREYQAALKAELSENTAKGGAGGAGESSSSSSSSKGSSGGGGASGGGGGGGGRGGGGGGGGGDGGGRKSPSQLDGKSSTAAKRAHATTMWADFTSSLFKGNDSEDAKLLRGVFDSIDADGGGTIDQAELKVALQSAGRECTDAQIVRMMRICDEDGDGQIDFDEFVHILKVVNAAAKLDALQVKLAARRKRRPTKEEAAEFARKAAAEAAESAVAEAKTTRGDEAAAAASEASLESLRAFHARTSVVLEHKLSDAQKQLEGWLYDAEKAKSGSIERLEAPSSPWKKKVALIDGKLGEETRALSKKFARASQTATVKLESALAEAAEKRNKVLAENKRACEEAIAAEREQQRKIEAEENRMQKDAAAAADSTAVQAAASRWARYLESGLVTGDASNCTQFADVERALELAEEALASRQRAAFAAKATTAQATKQAAADVERASVALGKAQEGVQTRLEAASHAFAARQAETDAKRALALERKKKAEEAVVPSNGQEDAGGDGQKQALAEAEAAQEAETRAKEAVAQAEADHARAEAEATAAIEQERRAADAALALTEAQLEVAEEQVRRLAAFQLAADEASVARKEVQARRAKVEKDRRSKEDARMRSQHGAISRRPGGKKVLDFVQRHAQRHLAAQREQLKSQLNEQGRSRSASPTSP